VLNVLSGILILVALISVAVAFVNTMNTMYTAVLERTREIGIMKAIGARNENILFIFVFESALLGFVGGVAGIMLGYLISSFGGAVAVAAGYSLLQPAFPWYLIVGCLLFAFIVGILSGLLPAMKASKLDPVEALRYE
jgi:putative ABC transport system permease protein